MRKIESWPRTVFVKKSSFFPDFVKMLISNKTL